jgi:ATP-binding cassette subfamily B protein
MQRASHQVRFSFARRLWGEMATHKAAVARFLAFSLLLNLCGLVVPWVTQTVLDRIVQGGQLTFLAQFILVLALVMSFEVLLTISRRLTLVRLSVALDRVLLSEFCNHVLRLPSRFFRNHHAGDVVARFNDGGQVRGLAAGSLTRSAIDAVMVAIYIGVMACVSIRLAVVVAALLALFAAYTFCASPLVKRLHRRLLEDRARHEAHLVETITSIDLVKALAVEQTMFQRWESAFGRYLASSYQSQKMRQILESAGAAIKFFLTAAILCYGAVLVTSGDLTTGQLVAFGMYASEALLPLVRLNAVWDELQEARAAVERMKEVLEQEPECASINEPQGAVRPLRGQVRFEKVHFTYGSAGAQEVLSGVNFEIRQEEHVALMGRSGAGKTTLARLLLGLYQPTSGRILIDGRDLREFDLRTYRRQVGVVPQENLLLSGTVRENISLGDPFPDDGRIVKAAMLAGAHEFIETMPRAYNTAVGEMGFTLSGGQRQRLSLARVLYRDPRLLILDEATNALDSDSSERVIQNLSKVLEGRTVLVIAHSTATVRWLDRVLVLEDGGITEDGRYQKIFGHRRAHYRVTAGPLPR